MLADQSGNLGTLFNQFAAINAVLVAGITGNANLSVLSILHFSLSMLANGLFAFDGNGNNTTVDFDLIEELIESVATVKFEIKLVLASSSISLAGKVKHILNASQVITQDGVSSAKVTLSNISGGRVIHKQPAGRSLADSKGVFVILDLNTNRGQVGDVAGHSNRNLHCVTSFNGFGAHRNSCCFTGKNGSCAGKDQHQAQEHRNCFLHSLSSFLILLIKQFINIT